MFNHQKLVCYQVALGVAKRVPSIVASWPKDAHYLKDQLKRAVSSVVLNIAEGNGRPGRGERGRFFAIARASAAESASAVELAAAIGLMDHSDSLAIQAELLQVFKMLCKLK
ncbi:MAG TPA: four helix bundle protein [bacterium]|nr:four helix bundle protein [bacterium]